MFKPLHQLSRSPGAQRLMPLFFPLALLLLVLAAPPSKHPAAALDSPIVAAAAQDAAQDAETPHDPYNFYFLKVPKVGGTTMAVLLQNYAKDYGLQIASPGPARTVQMCQGRDVRMPRRMSALTRRGDATRALSKLGTRCAKGRPQRSLTFSCRTAASNPL